VSNRQAVPTGQQDVQWMRDIEDRLKALETRKVQGNLALDVASIADLTFTATGTTPAKIAGSKTWTQAVEYLGTNPPGPNAGDDALVIRDELAVIRDMFPRQYAAQGAAPAQSIPSSAGTPLTLAGAVPTSSPYAVAAATAPGELIIPVSGIYLLLQAGVWGALADATVRLVAIEASTNGGATWATVFAVDQSNLNHAGFGQLQEVVGVAPLALGTRLRVNVDNRSAGALNYTPQIFSATFLRGPL